MNKQVPHPDATRRRKQRGFTLIAMALFAVVLVGTLGLAIDIGRLYIAKNEIQIYCDAAALAATARLNGLSGGIVDATNAAAVPANSWNLNSTTVSGAVLEFATSAAGPWASSPDSAVGYSYTRVRVPVQMPLYFLPIIVGVASQTVESIGVAGQIPIDSFPAGLMPYSLVSTDPTGPGFGLLSGNEYSIQWPQFNGKRAGCGPDDPGKCFNSPPCAGDGADVQWAVASNWSSSTNGYWGFSSSADIEKSVIDGLQLQSISIGQNILPIMTNGNKAAQAKVLDQRASQDKDYTSTSVLDYQGTTTHNGRRILLVPVLRPVSATVTYVSGFAAVLLHVNGSTSNYYQKTANGNDPFCATYMGPYTMGSKNPGAATSGSGAYRARLVL